MRRDLDAKALTSLTGMLGPLPPGYLDLLEAFDWRPAVGTSGVLKGLDVSIYDPLFVLHNLRRQPLPVSSGFLSIGRVGNVEIILSLTSGEVRQWDLECPPTLREFDQLPLVSSSLRDLRAALVLKPSDRPEADVARAFLDRHRSELADADLDALPEAVRPWVGRLAAFYGRLAILRKFVERFGASPALLSEAVSGGDLDTVGFLVEEAGLPPALSDWDWALADREIVVYLRKVAAETH